MEDSEAYIRYPKHRRWFDKLHLSETLGYDCGPCGVAPSKDGYYIVRPIYNLSGMSIGAKKVWIEKGDVSKVPRGIFGVNGLKVDIFLSVSHTQKDGSSVPHGRDSKMMQILVDSLNGFDWKTFHMCCPQYSICFPI